MRVYFVMDIMNGIVVRAYRGERERYRPISEFSEVVRSDDPLEVVECVRPRYLYVADIDRIEGRGDNLEIVKMLSRYRDVIADCGFRKPDELVNLTFTPVLGTETFDVRLLEDVDIPVFVSLDLIEGRPMNTEFELREVMDVLNSFDLLGVIVLTLDRVGSCSLDLETLGEVMELSDNPVLLGGGVSGYEDLLILKDMGCYGVLIATSVHKRSIDLDIIRRGHV